MSSSFVKAILRCALLLAVAASPSLALTLAVLPAQPLEGEPFTLAIGLVGSCPLAERVDIVPGKPGLVAVTLADSCLFPPRPTLLEVPLGPLATGPWNLRVAGGGPVLAVEVEPRFRLDFVPLQPREGSPFRVRLAGTGNCPDLLPAQQDGNLLTLRFDGDCEILPPPPAPFEVAREVEPLAAGDYVVQVVDFNDRRLASRRLHVFGSRECVPSETDLCLSQGRFRVQASWRTGRIGAQARVRPETADTGALWFFSPDNLELLVKVLDACQSPVPRFWVFTAGLTDVEVELAVTQMETGQTKRYHHAAGSPFGPILDTAAFPCPAAGG